MFEGIVLLAAHLVADFPLQTDHMAAEKLENHMVRLGHVSVHVYVMLVFCLLAGINVWSSPLFLVLYGVSHFVIDTRRWGEYKEDFPEYQYIIDQTMHVAAIGFLAVWFL